MCQVTAEPMPLTILACRRGLYQISHFRERSHTPKFLPRPLDQLLVGGGEVLFVDAGRRNPNRVNSGVIFDLQRRGQVTDFHPHKNTKVQLRGGFILIFIRYLSRFSSAVSELFACLWFSFNTPPNSPSIL